MTFHAVVNFKTPWKMGIESKREECFGHGFESSYWLENLIAVFRSLDQILAPRTLSEPESIFIS